MEKLDHCPFCGKEVQMVADERWPRNLDHSVTGYHAECQNYDCPIYKADTKYYRTEKKAAKVWNRRVHIVDCTKAEWQGGQCLGYGIGHGGDDAGDEPIEKCKHCPHCSSFEKE